MREVEPSSKPAYVVGLRDLFALNFLAPGHPRPLSVEWINRGNNSRLNPSSIEQLWRTLGKQNPSSSIKRQRETTGLRLTFRREEDRRHFAAAFAAARKSFDASRHNLLIAMFGKRESAERALEMLKDEGVPAWATNVLWRLTRFVDVDAEWNPGHSLVSVAGVTAGAGLAGASLGVALLAVPGIGQAAGTAALVASFSPIASVSGIIGATGGAISRMLDDQDVDDRFIEDYVKANESDKVFVSVDLSGSNCDPRTIRAIFARCKGREAYLATPVVA